MSDFLQQLAPSWDPEAEPFRQAARYYPAMDHLLYLTEDCSYRADRVDEWLTLLWHPHRLDLVGIKLKGIRAIFKGLLSDPGLDGPLLIAELLGEILMSGGAARIMETHEEERRVQLRKKYRMAIRFATHSNATVSSKELERSQELAHAA